MRLFTNIFVSLNQMDSLQHLTLLAMPSFLKWPIFLASCMAPSPSFPSHFSGVLFSVFFVDSFLKSWCSLEFCPQPFLFLHYICPGWHAFGCHLFADVFQIYPLSSDLALGSIPPRYPTAFRPLYLTSAEFSNCILHKSIPQEIFSNANLIVAMLYF